MVFYKARNRIQTPAKLEQLIKDFIDKHEWLSYDADVKGAAYEGLIEKTAQEGARGAGQYFTPRALISAIVDVMLPEASRPDMRSGLWHRRVLPGRLPVDHRPLHAPWSPIRWPTCGRVRSPAGR